jgi:importin-7
MQLANDGETLVKLLASTLNANLRKQAEEELTKCHNTTGFTPTLLQLIMTDNIEMPVRQAGVIYLKNMISQYWSNDPNETPTLPTLPENDKQLIRDNIIEAVIHSVEAIRAQLIVCVRTITTYDFPEKWTQIVDKVHQYIQTNNINSWYGALQAFYQLCKIYE